MAQHRSSPSLDPLDERELVRQLHLTDRLFKELGGSVPPEQVDLTQVRTALDVACGVGGWALDLAQAYPHITVTGIDTSNSSIEAAQRLGGEGGLMNARFVVQDMRALDAGRLPGAPFGLIHFAFIAPALLTTDYADLVRRLSQLCRPGGAVCWTEMELPITTSPAFERLITLTCRALQAAGHSFISPEAQELNAIFEERRRAAGIVISSYERRHLGITPMMGRWFREAGYQHIPSAIEVSAGMPMHPHFVRQAEVAGLQITPFLLEQGVIDEEELTRRLSQMSKELHQESFCGLCFLLTVYAHTPV